MGPPFGLDGARALLSRMTVSKAMARAELRELEPSLDEVRALYKEPAASRIFAAMGPKWARFKAGGELLDGERVLPAEGDQIVHLSTMRGSELATADRACPAEYRSVVEDLKPEAYLYCYAFSPMGLPGVEMDGLSNVGGHWVLVPRPWKLLGR